MITCNIPNDPCFNALRREAEHYLNHARSSRLRLVVEAGAGTAESYRLERRGDYGNLANLNIKAYRAWQQFRDDTIT